MCSDNKEKKMGDIYLIYREFNLLLTKIKVLFTRESYKISTMIITINILFYQSFKKI